jgi:hypothetical protein
MPVPSHGKFEFEQAVLKSSEIRRSRAPVQPVNWSGSADGFGIPGIRLHSEAEQVVPVVVLAAYRRVGDRKGCRTLCKRECDTAGNDDFQRHLGRGKEWRVHHAVAVLVQLLDLDRKLESGWRAVQLDVLRQRRRTDYDRVGRSQLYPQFYAGEDVAANAGRARAQLAPAPLLETRTTRMKERLFMLRPIRILLPWCDRQQAVHSLLGFRLPMDGDDLVPLISRYEAMVHMVKARPPYDLEPFEVQPLPACLAGHEEAFFATLPPEARDAQGRESTDVVGCQSSGIAQEHLLGPCPPFVRDFHSPEVSVELQQRAFRKVVRINAEEFGRPPVSRTPMCRPSPESAGREVIRGVDSRERSDAIRKSLLDQR